MRAGRLNQRITLQKKTTTFNAASHRSDSWVNQTTMWGEFVDPQGGRGRELYNQARQVQADMTHLVRIRRWESGTITPGDYRFTFGSRTLNILAVSNPHEGRRELLLSCREIV